MSPKRTTSTTRTPTTPPSRIDILNSDSLDFAYDASGNLLQKNNQLFVWDDSNRMSRANVEGTSNDLLNFYDAGGTRVFKNSSAFGTTLFVDLVD